MATTAPVHWSFIATVGSRQAIEVMLLLLVCVHLFLNEVFLFWHKVFPVARDRSVHLNILRWILSTVTPTMHFCYLLLQTLHAELVANWLITDGLRSWVSRFQLLLMIKLAGARLPFHICTQTFHHRLHVLPWLVMRVHGLIVTSTSGGEIGGAFTWGNSYHSINA